MDSPWLVLSISLKFLHQIPVFQLSNLYILDRKYEHSQFSCHYTFDFIISLTADRKLIKLTPTNSNWLVLSIHIWFMHGNSLVQLPTMDFTMLSHTVSSARQCCRFHYLNRYLSANDKISTNGFILISTIHSSIICWWKFSISRADSGHRHLKITL